VRIHTKSNIGVAPCAIALLVAPRTGLHLLARSLSVLQKPDGLSIVKLHIVCTARREPLALMTVTADGLGAVTRGALTFTPRSTGCVAAHEVDGVEAPSPDSIVAVGARSFLVTSLTCEAARRRRCRVSIDNVWRVDAHRSHERVG
jgi:hypothetical protein